MTFCAGIPGGSSPHRVADPDDLIAGICGDCERKLTTTASWSNQLQGVNEAKSKGGKKGGGKRASTEWRNYAVKFPKASTSK